MRKILLRLLRYIVVGFIFLLSLNVVLGATGFSEGILQSLVNQELRGIRQSLAETIRDPAELEEVMETKRHELEELHGLDQEWYVRLPQSTLRTLKGDFGYAKTLRSFSGSSKISEIILERLPNTVVMMLPAFGLSVLIGGFFGVWAATHPRGRIDRFVSFFGPASNALPAWWIGILVIMVFAVELNILPGGGMYSAPPPTATLDRFLDVIKHAILPITSLVLVSMGPYMYAIRSITLKVAQEPFVNFARARGFSSKRIWWRYILRPAAPPIATGLVLGIIASFSGAILTETVFNWPGMGRLYIDALLGTPDEGLILALTITFAVLFMVGRFILDILYVKLDPRVRY